MKMTSLAPWNWLDDRDEFDSTSNALLYPFQRMQREMERMVDSVGGGTREINGQRMVGPEVNISESDEAFHLEFDLPGVKKEDLDLTFQKGRLILRGERRSEKEEKGQRFRRVEKRYGSFERSLALPENIDSENIQAQFENGVLELTIPKDLKGPEQRKRIDIG